MMLIDCVICRPQSLVWMSLHEPRCLYCKTFVAITYWVLILQQKINQVSIPLVLFSHFQTKWLDNTIPCKKPIVSFNKISLIIPDSEPIDVTFLAKPELFLAFWIITRQMRFHFNIVRISIIVLNNEHKIKSYLEPLIAR